MFDSNFKVTKSETVKVEDTNPDLYVERFNIAIREENFPQALKDIEKAIQYSANNKKRLEYTKAKIDILYAFYGEGHVVPYIRSEIPFLNNNMKDKDVIELINKNVSSYTGRESLFRSYIENSSDLKNILIELSEVNKKFVSEYIYFNADRLINRLGLQESIKLIDCIGLESSQKLYILDRFYELNKYELEILMKIGSINVKKAKFYLDRDLLQIVDKIEINEFIEIFRKDNLLTSKDKINYLNKLLHKDKANLDILDEIIQYYNDNYDEAISYVDLLISSLYKNFKNLSLIYLRKGILYSNKCDLKNAEQTIIYAFELCELEKLSQLQKGIILHNLSIVYIKMYSQNKSKRYLRKAYRYYKKSRNYGYIGKTNKIIEDYDIKMKHRKISIICYILAFTMLIVMKICNSINTYNQNIYNDETYYYSEEENIDESYNEDSSHDYSSSKYNNNEYNPYDVNSILEYKDGEESYEYVDTNNSDLYYSVYTEAYYNYEYAENYVKTLKNKGIKSVIYEEDNIYKVRVGTAYTYEQAQDIAYEMSKKSVDTYILVYDSEIEEEINDIRLTYLDNVYQINIYEFDDMYEYIKSRIENRQGYGGYLKKLNDIYEEVHLNN